MKHHARLIMILFAILVLFAPAVGADNGPDVVTYAQESKTGPVTFEHEGHSDFVDNGCNNAACHGDSGEKTKIVLNKKTAHGKMCRTCHSHANKEAGDIIAPIKCYDCHLKNKNKVAPKLCQDGKTSNNCTKCHK